jgi:alkylation response protein AidB-like acyl-CoA dehydrogenase
VEFALDDQQRALQQTARGVLAQDHSDDGLWQRMVELGWVGLLVPTEHGGGGAGLSEVVVLLEEMGRVPLRGPFLSSAVLAPLACARLGLDDRLASLATGAVRGTVAIDEDGHGDVVDRIRTRASRRSGEWRLSGSKPVVLDGDTADWVLVPARTERGLGTFVVEIPGAEPVPGLDVRRSVARLVLDDRWGKPVGPEGDHTALWRRVVDDGAVALCAETLGTMEQAFDLAVEYAKVRVQFGRPIATFQAIKHKAAEMLERIELARVGVHYAAWASDADDAARAEAAAMAKSFVGRAANEVCGEAIQIHGGVGFTWDCPAHLHYRRAKSNDVLLGYHGSWRHRVAQSYLATA